MPWGAALGAFATRQLTGELVVQSEDGKTVRVAFLRGAVVAASSPLASDSAARIAVTSHLVSSTQVAAIAKRIAASPERDEVELLAEVARLAPEQADHLRRRVLVHTGSAHVLVRARHVLARAGVQPAGRQRPRDGLPARRSSSAYG